MGARYDPSRPEPSYSPVYVHLLEIAEQWLGVISPLGRNDAGEAVEVAVGNDEIKRGVIRQACSRNWLVHNITHCYAHLFVTQPLSRAKASICKH